MRNPYKVLRNADKRSANLSYICHRNQNCTTIMDTIVIISIIISCIVALVILALVIMLLFYHWRNKELMINFSAFIRENLILKDELTKLHNENATLNEELKSYNNK